MRNRDWLDILVLALLGAVLMGMLMGCAPQTLQLELDCATVTGQGIDKYGNAVIWTTIVCAPEDEELEITKGAVL